MYRPTHAETQQSHPKVPRSGNAANVVASPAEAKHPTSVPGWVRAAPGWHLRKHMSGGVAPLWVHPVVAFDVAPTRGWCVVEMGGGTLGFIHEQLIPHLLGAVGHVHAHASFRCLTRATEKERTTETSASPQERNV